MSAALALALPEHYAAKRPLLEAHYGFDGDDADEDAGLTADLDTFIARAEAVLRPAVKSFCSSEERCGPRR